MKTKFKPTQSEWLNIAKRIHNNYSNNERVSVNKIKVLAFISAFETLYGARITKNEDDYYIGNLVQPNLIVGRREDVLGTVPGNLELTRNSIAEPGPYTGRRASIVARNLVMILRSEQFRSDISELLAPHSDALRDLAAGQI